MHAPAPPPAPAANSDLPFEQIYERLRSIAQRERHRFSAGQTLNTTALVHEVYLDICSARENAPAPRDFFGYAARSMRNLLIDHARRFLRPKHGGGQHHTGLDSPAVDAVHLDASQALELDAALAKLATSDARAAEVVELHYFAGLDLAKIAELLGVSERTINRDWRVARAWLQRELTS
jgi:RNA polymerase sigma factor (TIGR02999 family)